MTTFSAFLFVRCWRQTFLFVFFNILFFFDDPPLSIVVKIILTYQTQLQPRVTVLKFSKKKDQDPGGIFKHKIYIFVRNVIVTLGIGSILYIHQEL